SRRRHTRCLSDWSSDVCSSDLLLNQCQSQVVATLGEVGPKLQRLLKINHCFVHLPYLEQRIAKVVPGLDIVRLKFQAFLEVRDQIGRASCRERGSSWEGEV